jgi:hypothetical protein
VREILLAVSAFALMLPLVRAQNGSDVSAKFAEAESHAPKGFPTLFIVRSSSRSPGQLFGSNGDCAMDLVTLGKVYDVYAQDTFRECVALSPHTVVWGHDHRIIGSEVIDLLDTGGPKPKSRRYLVRNVILVDPATQ